MVVLERRQHLQEQGGEKNPEEEGGNKEGGGEGRHPYDFHVSGPRNLSSPNWRDLFRSDWTDANYKRMVIACLIQPVYLLELDRQEKKTEENGLAPKWWKPFKYKLVQTLADERDGSIYGALLAGVGPRRCAIRIHGDETQWRLEGWLFWRSGGTLLKSPTIRRDLEDDLRFLAWESLKGSVRFIGALQVLKSAVDRCGSGHSLGAGFALQVGKALAKRKVFVECHLFNPPPVSLAMSIGDDKYW